MRPGNLARRYRDSKPVTRIPRWYDSVDVLERKAIWWHTECEWVLQPSCIAGSYNRRCIIEMVAALSEIIPAKVSFGQPSSDCPTSTT